MKHLTPSLESSSEREIPCWISQQLDSGGIQSEPGMRTKSGIASGIAALVRAVTSRRRRMRSSRLPEYGAGRLFVAAVREAWSK
jgi:hypothetical protein